MCNTLNSNARWTQRPTGKPPIGRMTDFRPLLRIWVHSVHRVPKFSSVEDPPLLKTIRACQDDVNATVTAQNNFFFSFLFFFSENWTQVNSPQPTINKICKLISSKICRIPAAWKTDYSTLQFSQTRISRFINSNHYNWRVITRFNWHQGFKWWNHTTILHIRSYRPCISIHPMD